MEVRNIAGWLRLWLAIGYVLLGSSAFAAELMEDVDYRTLNPSLETVAGKKIEVIEFFWYNCPHCNAMAPLIEPWAKRNHARIVFKRVPYARSEEWIAQQQFYYTLQAMGKVEKLHMKVFQAIHEHKIALKTVEQMANFAQRYGIDRKRFLKVFNSPAILQEVMNAEQLASQAGVERVPTIVVDGRFMTYADLIGGSNKEVLEITDKLVSQARQSR